MDCYSDRLPYLADNTPTPHWPQPFPPTYPADFPQAQGPSAALFNSVQPYHSATIAPILHYQAPYPIQQTYPYYTASDGPAFSSAPMQLQFSDPEGSCTPAVHIHSPIPVSAYSTLLPHLPDSASHQALASGTSQPSPPIPEQTEQTPEVSQLSGSPAIPAGQPVSQASPEQYVHGEQVMFPTPCDLLKDLNSRDQNVAQAAPSFSSAQMQPSSDDPVVGEKATGNSIKSKIRHATRKPRQTSDAKPENQRKAYFRSVAENVCFQPTDPDTITSHDKKRLHLECLEKYILWLHEQLRLVGKEPVALERVSSYPGLSNRSVRTLLVHMQEEAKKLHEQISEEEQEFFDLQEQILARGVPVNIEMPEIKRHSIATPMTGLSLQA